LIRQMRFRARRKEAPSDARTEALTRVIGYLRPARQSRWLHRCNRKRLRWQLMPREAVCQRPAATNRGKQRRAGTKKPLALNRHGFSPCRGGGAFPKRRVHRCGYYLLNPAQCAFPLAKQRGSAENSWTGAVLLPSRTDLAAGSEMQNFGEETLHFVTSDESTPMQKPSCHQGTH